MGVTSKEEYDMIFGIKYPPSTEKIFFWTSDGKKHYGFFVKDINKFIKNVNRWKDADKNIWYKNEEVMGWEYLS